MYACEKRKEEETGIECVGIWTHSEKDFLTHQNITSLDATQGFNLRATPRWMEPWFSRGSFLGTVFFEKTMQR